MKREWYEAVARLVNEWHLSGLPLPMWPETGQRYLAWCAGKGCVYATTIDFCEFKVLVTGDPGATLRELGRIREALKTFRTGALEGGFGEVKKYRDEANGIMELMREYGRHLRFLAEHGGIEHVVKLC